MAVPGAGTILAVALDTRGACPCFETAREPEPPASDVDEDFAAVAHYWGFAYTRGGRTITSVRSHEVLGMKGSRKKTGARPTRAGKGPAPASAPSPEEVARRAYEIYLARGGEPGRKQEDWLQAERELRQKAGS